MVALREMSRPGTAFACAMTWLGILAVSPTAGAQVPPPETWGDDIHVGNWVLRPSVEVRVRGEYRRRPVDVGGNVYDRTAVQSDAFASAAPGVVAVAAPALDEWLASERLRLGLGVQYGKVSAVLTLQDARVLGWLPGSSPDAPRPGSGVLEPYEGYLQVRDDENKPMVEARFGRQPIFWGEGRLLGLRDWWQRAAPLDAARLRFHFGDGLADLDAFAAMLAMPGPISPPDARLAPADGSSPTTGTGAQLYGLQNAWHVVPLFQFEVGGLARIARDPIPIELARADTYTVDLRVFGDYRGVSYSAEGAYQLGRVAGFGTNRGISAFAAAARFDWQTALPGDLRFGVSGAYASGDDSNGRGDKLMRFDPILADVHRHHGAMDLYAWSNLIEGAGSFGARPRDDLDLSARYAFAGLAQPNDRWSSGGLVAVGADPNNTSHVLGHEVDARIAYEPWRGVVFEGGYGIFITGEGARNILVASGRGDPSLLHYGYLQAGLRAP